MLGPGSGLRRRIRGAGPGRTITRWISRLAVVPLVLTLATIAGPPAAAGGPSVPLHTAVPLSHRANRRGRPGGGGGPAGTGDPAASGGTLTAALPVASAVDHGALAEARSWLARELHDGAVQRLTSMVVQLEQLKRHGGSPAELERIQASTRATIGDLRRLLSDLRDEPATDTCFLASIRELLSDLADAGVGVEYVVQSWPEELPTCVSTDLRRILGEAVTNVRRHSQATRVTVTLQALNGFLALTVVDNGSGMVGSENGFGLRGMAERARLHGGRVIVDGQPGCGTTVRCIVPFGVIT